MAQARATAELLQPLCGEVEIVPIRTSGDAGNRDKLGAFVSEIQHAALAGEIDLGLHCLKDLPTGGVDGLVLAVHLPREDVRDAFLTRGESWIDLPRDSLVGTGSLRRTSQIASHRPDLRFRPLRGNIDTRMRKLREREYDAVVLAIAGLKRLGLLENWAETGFHLEPLEPSIMLPAPGQAVLVLECREDNHALRSALGALNDAGTEACATAERSFLARFGGGCSVPVAALAVAREDVFELHGLVASPDGTNVLRGSRSGTDPKALGSGLAEELGGQGGFEIVANVGRTPEAV